MEDGQQNPVAGCHIADIKVPAPFTLSIQAGRHFTVGADTESSNERRDRPLNLVAEVQSPVAGRSAGTGCVLKDLGRVFAREFRPASGFAQGAAARPSGDPRIAVDEDIFDSNDERVSLFRSFDKDRTRNGVRQGRRSVEAGPLARDCQIGSRFEEASAGVVSLNFKALTLLDLQQRFVAEVEGILTSLFAIDPLHDNLSSCEHSEAEIPVLMR